MIEGKRKEETIKLDINDQIIKNERLKEITQMTADAMFTINSNNRQRESNQTIFELNKRKEIELSNKNLTDEQRIKIEQKYNERIRLEKIKAFKAEQRAAIVQAIINGALAMTKVSAQTGMLTFAFSPLVAASVLAQIAVIKSQKPPDDAMEGYEDGGYLNVTRRQDGKKFKAKDRGERRGYFNRPSVLISENGEEFVASAQAVRNDSVRPFLDMIDSAQRNGTINTLNMERMFSRPISTGVMPGKEDGGYLSSNRTSSISSMPGSMTDSQLLEYLKENSVIMQQLKQILSQPIEANVSLLGKSGFIEKQKEYDQIQELGNL